MFVDASALVAIMANEPGYVELLERLEQADERATSPLVVWETTAAVARKLGLPIKTASDGVFEYLDIADITLVALPVEATSIAIDALDGYGKGRHPARLNFGDCFAYACARHFNLPAPPRAGPC